RRVDESVDRRIAVPNIPITGCKVERGTRIRRDRCVAGIDALAEDEGAGSERGTAVWNVELFRKQERRLAGRNLILGGRTRGRRVGAPTRRASIIEGSIRVGEGIRKRGRVV